MYPRTERTTATRTRDRMSYDETAAHAVLDEAYHCALGFTVDGEPRVLPTLHVRVGDTLYLHGSTGSRPLLAARGDAGLPVCVAVTLLDALIYGRSQFHHSANYRSVVAHGTARLVTDEREKIAVLTALVEKAAVGRSADSRPPSRRELAETAVLALPLREVSVRDRTGGVNDDPADLDLPYWAGVLPLRLIAGVPEPAPGVTAPLPAYLRPARSAWLEPVVLRGEHVVLEPLDLSHAEELYAALDDPEVWRYIGTPADRPTPRRPGRSSGPCWRPTTGACGCRGRCGARPPARWSAPPLTCPRNPAPRWRSAGPCSAGPGGGPGSTPRRSCCCSPGHSRTWARCG